MTAAPGLLIRADGDGLIGAGHVMRTLALAIGARARGATVTLAAASLSDALASRVAREGVQVVRRALEPGSPDDAAWLAGVAEGHAGWVVIDGDRFGAEYRSPLQDAGLRVLMVDDYGRSGPYETSMVLNQNVFAAEALYRERLATTRLLLGPEYALLRPEFAAAAARPSVLRERASRVLVTFGGADPEHVTERVVVALAHLHAPDLQIRVVAGPANPRAHAQVAETGSSRVQVVSNPDDMAALMAWADLAIAGAGSTVYELCALGVPTMVIAIVEGQAETAAALGRAGLCYDLGHHGALDTAALGAAVLSMLGDVARRRELSRHGRVRVDAQGVVRVLAAMAAN